MALKHFWFNLRDSLRFKIAQAKYDFKLPSEQELKQNFSFNTIKHVVVLKMDGKLGDTEVMSHFYQCLRQQENPRLILSAVCPNNLVEVYRDVLKFDIVEPCSRKPKLKEIKALSAKIHEQANIILAKEQQSQAFSENNAKDFRAISSMSMVDLVVTTEPRFRPRDFQFAFFLKPKFIAGFEKRAKCVNLLLADLAYEERPFAQILYDFMQRSQLDLKQEHIKHSQYIQYTPFTTEASLEKIQSYLKEQLEATLRTSSYSNDTDCHKASSFDYLRKQQCLIGLNPFASSSSRSFTVDMIKALIKAILDCRKEVNLEAKLQSKQDYEQAHTKEDSIIDAVDYRKSQALRSNTNTEYLPCKVVLLCSPQEEQLKQELSSTFGQDQLLFLPKNSSVCDFASMIAMLDLLVTVDTAAVHLACASNIPQLCVYTGTDLKESLRWAPQSAKAQVFREEGLAVNCLDIVKLTEVVRSFVNTNVGSIKN